MPPYALFKMIQKFERTGELCILLGRDRKKIFSYNLGNAATVVVEASTYSLHGSISISNVTRVYGMSHFTVGNDLWRVSHFYPNKMKTMHICRYRTKRFLKIFHISPLFGWCFMLIGQRTFSRVMNPTFA